MSEEQILVDWGYNGYSWCVDVKSQDASFDEGVMPNGKAVQIVLKILFYEPQSCMANWRRLKNKGSVNNHTIVIDNFLCVKKASLCWRLAYHIGGVQMLFAMYGSDDANRGKSSLGKAIKKIEQRLEWCRKSHEGNKAWTRKLECIMQKVKGQTLPG